MISIYHYKDVLKRITLEELNTLSPVADGMVWIDLQDPTPGEEESVLHSLFSFHHLTVDDCRRGKDEVNHPPKVEDFRDYLFVIFNPMQAMHLVDDKLQNNYFDIRTTQLSAYLLKNVLVTHHYKTLPSVEYARQTCEKSPHLLGHGPDFLFHLIIDNVVDNYTPLLDDLDTMLDGLEEEVFHDATQKTMARILQVKKSILTIRRIAVYQREMLNRLSRGEFPLITFEEMAYYRNVYDHLVRMNDLADSYRDTVAGLMDAYLSVTSNRLNQIMKVLTIISTIFLPLNFITGFFGMNFRALPLTDTWFGVEVAILLMLFVGIGMVWWFRRNKWM